MSMIRGLKPKKRTLVRVVMGSNTDELVLRFLRSAGIEFSDSVISCELFDPENIYAVAAQAVNSIAKSAGEDDIRLPEKLSGNPGARFRACTNLSEAITNLGFAGELGFNHFLYPSEAECRKLVLFLVGEMPKMTSAEADAAGGAGLLRFADQVRQALNLALHTAWVPPTWQARRAFAPSTRTWVRGVIARSALVAVRRAERQETLEKKLLGGMAAPSRHDILMGGFGDDPPIAPLARRERSGGAFSSHRAEFAHNSAEANAAVVKGDPDLPTECAAQRAERLEQEQLDAVLAKLGDINWCAARPNGCPVGSWTSPAKQRIIFRLIPPLSVIQHLSPPLRAPSSTVPLASSAASPEQPRQRKMRSSTWHVSSPSSSPPSQPSRRVIIWRPARLSNAMTTPFDLRLAPVYSTTPRCITHPSCTHLPPPTPPPSVQSALPNLRSCDARSSWRLIPTALAPCSSQLSPPRLAP